MSNAEDAALAALKAELESCRSRLSTAEKEIAQAREEREAAFATAEDYAAALEKALGALRAAPHDWLCRSMVIVEGAFPTHRDAPPQRIRPREPRDESLCSCWKREALSGGAHVDGPKAPPKESFNQRTARAGLGHGPPLIDEDYPEDAPKARADPASKEGWE